MSWLGKVIGGAFGFVVGGPIGAALGAALGHQFDQGAMDFKLDGAGFAGAHDQRVQMAFFGASFQVMGHVAKLDGRVSEAEIETARTIMDRMRLSEALRKSAMHLFNDGKRESFPLDQVLDQFYQTCGDHAPLLRLFVSLQLEVALADGRLQPVEEQTLLHLCDRLDFSRYEFFGIKTRLETERRLAGFYDRPPRDSAYQQRQERRQQQWQRHEPPRPRETPLVEAYGLLGLTPAASDSEIKRAYRRRISQHHPDKLAAQGVSPARMQQATEQTQKIQKAYDAICKVRNL